MKKILFICTGNTCRSSMAEGILKKFINDDPLLKNQYIVESAGISTYDGQEPSKESVEVLKNFWNIDISNHKSRLINKEIMKSASLVLTMTKEHSDYLLFDFPLQKNTIFTLKEYLGYNSKNIDIIDPYGYDIKTYQKCAKELYDCLLLLVEKLKYPLKK